VDVARRQLGGRAVLVDPAPYADPKSAGKLARESREWRAGRQQLARPGLFDLSEPRLGMYGSGGTTVLEGGSLVNSGGRGQLADILARPAGAGTSPVALALTARWFRGAFLDALVDEVAAAARPVALVLADAFNLLDNAGTVTGLVQLIREVRPVPVALLRCDISAVGAVAYGAAFGAVGLGTSSRHYSTGMPGLRPGATPDRSPRLFVPELLDYFKASRLPELVTGPDDPLLRSVLSCGCEGCDGRGLLRFAGDAWDAGGRVAPGSKLAAERHNLYATEDVAWKVVRVPPHRRPALWRQMCCEAAMTLEDIRERQGGNVPEVSSWLRQWCALPDIREPSPQAAPL
jgi:hypothetical protein